MENHKIIDRMLADRFGKHLDGRPKYRLVWATTQTEKRFCVVERETPAGIYIGGSVELRERPKYPFCPDRWVLEQLVFSPIPEIPETANGHYEPLYVFQDKNREYLKPLWEVCERILHTLLHGRIMNKTERIDEEDASVSKEQKYFEEVMENESPYLAGKLRDGEAIVVPGGLNG